MRLHGRLVPRSEITAAQREAMFALMDDSYEGVRRDRFGADLDEKDWVIQVFDPDGRLCGFSTQMLLRAECDGAAVVVLFSGDTVVAREHWGDAALAHVWGRLALRLIDENPATELYWFLISKGYKTYRFLPIFFRDFHPRPGGTLPPRVRAVRDTLALRKYPDAFDAARGVVRARPGQDRLRRGVADVTPGRLRDPFVRFFVESNPGHAAGDELCCLAPLTRANFTAAAWRVIEAGTPQEGVRA
jgi:hypothetical protein